MTKKYGAVDKTAKTLELNRSALPRIVSRGEIKTSRRGGINQEKENL